MPKTTRKVTDPVCGMSFNPEKTVAQVTYDGVTYHFCTEACRKQFDAQPDRYVAHREGPAERDNRSGDWIG